MALTRRSPGVGVETADTSISGQNIWHTVFEPAVLTIPVRGVAQAEDGTPFSISEGVARGYLETGCPGESSACQNHFEGSVEHDALSFLRDLTTPCRANGRAPILACRHAPLCRLGDIASWLGSADGFDAA